MNRLLATTPLDDGTLASIRFNGSTLRLEYQAHNGPWFPFQDTEPFLSPGLLPVLDLLQRTFSELDWTLKTGVRVELHPGSNRWMRGDRYGEIVWVETLDYSTLDRDRLPDIRVKLDKSRVTVYLPGEMVFPI